MRVKIVHWMCALIGVCIFLSVPGLLQGARLIRQPLHSRSANQEAYSPFDYPVHTSSVPSTASFSANASSFSFYVAISSENAYKQRVSIKLQADASISTARMVVVQKLAIPPAAVARSRTDASNSPSLPPFEPLTPREKDVLWFVVSGRSNKQIAKKLNISQKTVEVYLYRITRKLRVPTRVGVAVMAIKLGLVNVQYEDLQVGDWESV